MDWRKILSILRRTPPKKFQQWLHTEEEEIIRGFTVEEEERLKNAFKGKDIVGETNSPANIIQTYHQIGEVIQQNLFPNSAEMKNLLKEQKSADRFFCNTNMPELSVEDDSVDDVIYKLREYAKEKRDRQPNELFDLPSNELREQILEGVENLRKKQRDDILEEEMDDFFDLHLSDLLQEQIDEVLENERKQNERGSEETEDEEDEDADN